MYSGGTWRRKTAAGCTAQTRIGGRDDGGAGAPMYRGGLRGCGVGWFSSSDDPSWKYKSGYRVAAVDKFLPEGT